MATVHRIRLRGGWAVELLPDGRTRRARRFGSPRALDPAEAVWLTVAALPDPAVVTVNGTAFGLSTDRFEADITKLLQPRNEVWIDAVGISEPGEVVIEFRAG